jgi:hypothetical protein
VIQPIEALAESVIVAEIPDRERPFADRRRFRGDFVDSWRQRVYVERLLVHCTAVQQKAVKREIFGYTARVRNREVEFCGGCRIALPSESATRQNRAQKREQSHTEGIPIRKTHSFIVHSPAEQTPASEPIRQQRRPEAQRWISQVESYAVWTILKNMHLGRNLGLP